METLYVGSSKEKYHQIMCALEKAHIKYKFQTISHEKNVFSPGIGTGRDFGLNRADSDKYAVYEVMVSGKDLEEARNLVRGL